MSLPDKNTYANMGGELQDYEPAEDPTTDLPAAADNEARSDCAAMTRTALRAWCSFTEPSTVVAHDSVWGTGVAVAPTVARSSAGVYTVTWPATVTDARGNTHALNLQRAWASVEYSGANGLWQAQARVTAPNAAEVVTSQGGTLGDPTDTIAVYVL